MFVVLGIHRGGALCAINSPSTTTFHTSSHSAIAPFSNFAHLPSSSKYTPKINSHTKFNFGFQLPFGCISPSPPASFKIFPRLARFDEFSGESLIQTSLGGATLGWYACSVNQIATPSLDLASPLSMSAAYVNSAAFVATPGGHDCAEIHIVHAQDSRNQGFLFESSKSRARIAAY